MDAAMSNRLSPVDISLSTQNGSDEFDKKYNVDEDQLTSYQEQILSGAQLSEPRDFKDRTGKTVTVTPLILDFRRIIQSKSPINIVPGIGNQELLHAVVGLYNTSLHEMTPDVLYASVCDKQARTIVLIQDSTDAALEYGSREAKPAGDDSVETETDLPDLPDIYTAGDDGPGFYAGVFSDQDEPEPDSEEDEDEEEEEEEDFSQGVRTFLKKVKERRKEITKDASSTPQLGAKHMGIEHRLVAAATFEKTYCKPTEKIIHLTLVAVRRKFRKLGLGKYLLSQVKDMSTVGQYEAVVVHADNTAIDFFQRYAFTDDIILNSRWSELAEQYTNCTLMCYLPPFTNQALAINAAPELDIIAMEREIKKWRERSLDAYRAEMSCVNKMRHEIIHLRALVSSQQDLITMFTTDNDKLRHEKFLIEKEFLEYKLSSTKAAFCSNYSDDEDDIPGAKLIRDLEKELYSTGHSGLIEKEKGDPKYLLRNLKAGEPYDHGKDTEEFYKVTSDFTEALKSDKSITTQYQVQMVTKAILVGSYGESYKTRLSSLNDPTLVTRLYFCGGLEQSNRIQEILRNGFTDQDMTHGEFGRGLYFSKYPSKAAHFSPLGLLLVAEVALGLSETLVRKDKTRHAPAEYFDSVITPGRLCFSEDDQTLCQEYVVYDVYQALPLYLITYQPNESRTTQTKSSQQKSSKT